MGASTVGHYAQPFGRTIGFIESISGRSYRRMLLEGVARLGACIQRVGRCCSVVKGRGLSGGAWAPVSAWYRYRIGARAQGARTRLQRNAGVQSVTQGHAARHVQETRPLPCSRRLCIASPGMVGNATPARPSALALFGQVLR